MFIYNYADEHSLTKSAPDVNEVSNTLQCDRIIAIEWFKTNDMQASPCKFQFMMASSKHLSMVNITTDTNTVVENTRQSLGVTLDTTLTFSEHVSTM